MVDRKWIISEGAEEQFAKKELVYKELETMRYLMDSLFAVVQNEGQIITEGDLLLASNQLMEWAESVEKIDDILLEVFQYAVSNEVEQSDE